MLFNSVTFLVFLAIVYLVYWNLRGVARQYFLVLASVLFYAYWGLESEGWWGLRWTVHFLSMVGINYLFVRAMMHRTAPERGRLLAVNVLINLSNLGVFKYFAFVRMILVDLGVPVPEAAREVDLFLPLAISFYTFQLIAYSVDVARDIITENPGFRRYFLFILFFPQLIAGPIMRSTDFMGQIDDPKINKRRLYDGGWLIIGGLLKKVLLADPMGFIIAPVFREPQTYNAWSLLLAGMGFSLQVYCDFSGYTDIARGAARLLGYEIPENFLAPYFSRNARELWGKRWHITLNTWLRDYIYIPLGGSRVSRFRTHMNLAVTFMIGGLWHGADYSYIIWGVSWGLLLALERILEDDLGIQTTPKNNRFLLVLKILFMFFLFSLGAIMFRSQRVVYPAPDTRSYSSGYIMGEMFAGLALNTPDAARDDYAAAGADPALTEAVFGPEIFTLNDIGHSETFLYMFAALIFFHVIQYRPGLFERWRRYDFWLILLAGAITGGILLPTMAEAAHQFIYFVF